MENLTILPGRNRQGQPEDFISIHLARGRLYTIVGNTGSGKSRLIKDVEQLAQGDSVTGRTILLDGTPVSRSRRQMLSGQMVAHLGQNMRFVLDTTVKEFLPQPTNHTRRNSGTCKRHHTGTRIIGTKPQPAQRRTVQSPDDRGYLSYLRQPHCTD